MKSTGRRFGPLVGALLLAALAIGASAYLAPYPAPGIAADALPPKVRAERAGPLLAFVPASSPRRTGLVFYPGAKVPPEAYAYIGAACAQAGYVAVLPRMPLGLAILRPGAAASAFAAYPSVERWVVGGHSLGGAMATSFAAREATAGGRVAGLFLLAAWPGGGADLSSSSLPATSVSASADGLATPDKIARARRRMPARSRFVELSGGNHAQFGEYGPQPGDGVAQMPASAQRAAVVEEALDLLRGVESAGAPIGSAPRGK